MTDLTEADKGHVRSIWQKLFADAEANGRTVVLSWVCCDVAGCKRFKVELLSHLSHDDAHITDNVPSHTVNAQHCALQDFLCSAGFLDDSLQMICFGLNELFTDHPETKKYFKNFKNISTPEEMQKSAQIKRHGKAVMNRLNDIVENLDDWDSACVVMTDLAESHVYKHKVEVQNFQVIFNVIIKILTESLGASFTPEMRESWQKLFNIIYKYLENCYKELEAAS